MPSEKRLEQLFQIAVEQAPERRAEFLAVECGEDTALLAELHALLNSDAAAGSIDFWNCSAIEVEALRSAHENDPRVGQTIGPYRILEAISSGGMGTVYQAVRDDATYQKHVAIKVIKRGMDTDFVVHRFRTERQILANLEHPNIARLLDGGATEDGLPYLVMEYIEGQPIDQYAQQNQLSIAQRLQLFRTVCSAVQYAHQNLVVHRDLKPSNILVTREGEPKLLDFGIAKILSPDRSPANEQTTPQTAPMMRFLTPDYASPEQVRGEPITTVSDIYSLGVLLYRLLTGQRPYRVKSDRPEELANAICTVEPDKPSTAISRSEPRSPGLVETGKLRRRLRGDLDNIVLMAIRKEPERRYTSVEQFSEDIRRHLEGLPVAAHRDTLGYRSGKFIRRHRTGVAAAGLIVLCLLGGIVGTVWQAHVARVERARAEKRFAEVRKLANSFLFEFHDSLANIPGTLAARQLILKRALEYLDDLAREAGGDKALQSELASAYEKVGTLTWDVSARLNIHRKALALAESMVQGDPANKKYREQLAASHSSVGDSLKDKNDLQGSYESYRQDKEVTESLADSDPGNAAYQAALADSVDRMAVILQLMGRTSEALELNFRSRTLLQALLQTDPGNIELRRGVMNNLLFIARCKGSQGDYKAALENCRLAGETAKSLNDTDPNNAVYKRDLWINHMNVASLLLREGNPSGALAEYRNALAFIDRLSSADPGDKGHRRGLAVTYMGVADTLTELSQFARAQEYYGRAIATSQALLAADPNKGETRTDLALMYTRLGTLFLKSRDWTKAADCLNKGRDLYERAPTIDPNGIAAARGRAELYARLGDLNANQDRRNEARVFYQRSLDIWQGQRERNSLQAVDFQRPAELARALARLER
jgi:eukaryotic-like serine/threonine-protein kinase